jgi:selenoprotein W-related protein
LAAELKKNLGANTTLTPGSGGVFDVIVDGKTVFSKKSVGRFPDDGEVLEKLKQKK